MTYVTECPHCGEEGTLVLAFAHVYPNDNIYIQSDGFVIEGSMDTDEEIIVCRDCGWRGKLRYEEDTE